MSFGDTYTARKSGGAARPAAASAAAGGRQQPLLASQGSADAQKALKAVKTIQRHMEEIQKQTQALEAPNANLETRRTCRSKVDNAWKAGNAAAREAEALLKAVGSGGQGASQREPGQQALV